MKMSRSSSTSGKRMPSCICDARAAHAAGSASMTTASRLPPLGLAALLALAPLAPLALRRAGIVGEDAARVVPS